MRGFIRIETTCAREDAARELARALVESRLAACVQVEGPIESVYRWKGAVETAREWRLAIKTAADRYDAVAAEIRARHDYETPEILAVPVAAGDPDYLAWAASNLEDPACESD